MRKDLFDHRRIFDARDHLLVVGQLAQKVGPRLARGLGAAYEATDFTTIARNPADTLMDLHNNAIGAGLGAKAGSYKDLYRQAIRLARKAKRREQGLAAALDYRPEEPVYLSQQ